MLSSPSEMVDPWILLLILQGRLKASDENERHSIPNDTDVLVQHLSV